MHDSPSATVGDPPPGGQAAQEASRKLVTVRLETRHKIAAFCCTRSPNVTDFLRNAATKWEAQKYCSVWILEDPSDRDRVWGYYTLSATSLEKAQITTQHQKKAIGGVPVPLVRIGFMGRDDSSIKKLGAALIADAALRVSQNDDLPTWGLTLDVEGGWANTKLTAWYESVGFKRAKTFDGVMYGPLKSFLAV